MGFITMKKHHLAEYFWNFFQASKKEIHGFCPFTFPASDKSTCPMFWLIHVKGWDLTLYGRYDTVDGVDGQNSAPPRMMIIPVFIWGFDHPRWLFGISSVNYVWYSRSLWKSGIINSNQPIPRDGIPLWARKESSKATSSHSGPKMPWWHVNGGFLGFFGGDVCI